MSHAPSCGPGSPSARPPSMPPLRVALGPSPVDRGEPLEILGRPDEPVPRDQLRGQAPSSTRTSASSVPRSSSHRTRTMPRNPHPPAESTDLLRPLTSFLLAGRVSSLPRATGDARVGSHPRRPAGRTLCRARSSPLARQGGLKAVDPARGEEQRRAVRFELIFASAGDDQLDCRSAVEPPLADRTPCPKRRKRPRHAAIELG